MTTATEGSRVARLGDAADDDEGVADVLRLDQVDVGGEVDEVGRLVDARHSRSPRCSNAVIAAGVSCRVSARRRPVTTILLPPSAGVDRALIVVWHAPSCAAAGAARIMASAASEAPANRPDANVSILVLPHPYNYAARYRRFAKRRQFDRTTALAPLHFAGRPAYGRLALLGRRQVVRQRFLVPAFAGSNPAAPASFPTFPPADRNFGKIARFEPQGPKPPPCRPGLFARSGTSRRAGWPTRSREASARGRGPSSRKPGDPTTA